MTADRGAAGPAFWCARSPQSTLLGAYDGIETWTLTAEALTDWGVQTHTSRHELLHHLLQEGTPWGRIGMAAGARAGVGPEPAQMTRLFRFCRSAARTVHEVFATTLSLGGAEPGALPDLSPEYRAFLELGNRIGAPADWDARRHVVDAVLRLCMAPAGLDGLLRPGLDHASLRPDDRLAAVLEAGLPRLDCTGLGPDARPQDVADFFDRVAIELNRIKVPTLPVAAIRVLMDVLDDRPPPTAAESAPDPDPVAGVLPVPEADGVEHYQRQGIELRANGPLKVALVPAEEVRPDRHDLVFWCRADLLARQFSRPNGLDGRTGHIVAIPFPGPLAEADGAVRLAVFESDDPATVARLWPAPGIWVTTAASLVDAPEHARSDGIATLYAIVDLPVYEFLSHTWRLNSTIKWVEIVHEANLKAYVLAWKTAAIPDVVWLHFATSTSRELIRDWFSAQPPGRAEHHPASFGDEEGDIRNVIRGVLATWWVIDQLGGRAHG